MNEQIKGGNRNEQFAAGWGDAVLGRNLSVADRGFAMLTMYGGKRLVTLTT